MSDKQHIIDSIVRVASELGRTPSHSEFIAHSEISAYSIMRSFECWNDAVRAAGLRPSTRNVRVEDRALLEDWGRLARRNRGIPTFHAYRRKGKYESCTIARRFGTWSKVPEAFRNFAKGKPVALLPAAAAQKEGERPKEGASLPIAASKARCTPFKDRATYGNPIHLRGFAHEPVNEQGVVLLFGMLARDLGYRIEAVQKGFPDCEAKRQIGPERWQRVNIEFEFESRNFREHRHPLHGCDIIVCWRHNWDDCPKHIEVVELSSVVKSLANSNE